MKIGIVADTHDNIAAIQKAVIFFNKQDLKYVIHAGDFVSPFSLKELMKLKAKLIGVFGNNDEERKELLSICKDIHEPPFNILLDGKHIIVTHMIDDILKRSTKGIDIIISAHTHIPEIKGANPVYINPGECCGWLNGRSTVAMLDIKTLHAEIVDLSEVSLD